MSTINELVNSEREQAGLLPVELHPTLCRLARIKAADMCSTGYFGHRSPTLGTMPELVGQYLPDFLYVGENIAWNFQDQVTVHRAWMASCLHRRNILDKNFSHFGYGWWQTPEGFRIYVQIFCGGGQ